MAFQWVCASSPFGPPTLEFFGNSLEPPPASLRVAMRRCRYWAFDALVCTWPDWVLYAFPPFSIIDRVLLKIFPGTSASPPPRGATPPFGAVVPSAASSFAVGSPDSAHDLTLHHHTSYTRCQARRTYLWRCGLSAAQTSRLGIQRRNPPPAEPFTSCQLQCHLQVSLSTLL